MSGEYPCLNPLASRKQLLIAESELNRAHIREEWQAMTDGFHSLAGRAKSLGAMASSAAVLAAGLVAFRRARSVNAVVKPSRLKTLLKGAGLLSTVWRAFRRPGRDRGNN